MGSLFRSSHRRCSVKKGALNDFRYIHRKTPVLELENTCNFIKKETPTQVFSCEYCEIFKNTYFEERLRTAGSVIVLTKVFFLLGYSYLILRTRPHRVFLY